MIVFRAAAVVCGAAIFLSISVDAQQVLRGKQFPRGTVRQLQDLPASRFRDKLEKLPPQARARAVAWLGNFHFTAEDLNSLRADANGGIFYEDNFQLAPPETGAAQTEPVTANAAVPVSPFPSSLKFHSRPGAVNVLYINFTGETVTGTAWNTSLGRSSIPAVGFSTDSDFSTFSDSEQLAIKRIWERVAEDYSPFNIDVTTERPTFTTRVAHALVTRSTDANGQDVPAANSGGVAYVSVFGTSSYATYRPAWIIYDNLANEESYIAEAVSHEIGHNMGLSHDGLTDGTEYYGGHGSGETSWGPVMGTGYNRNVSQWSKGEYYLANNSQDDLAIIAGKLSYRSDDHGNTLASATPLQITGGTNIISTTPETDPKNTSPANKGVLERNNDVDMFSFTTGSGAISLSVKPWIVASGLTKGGNVDLLLELYNQSGQLILTNNVASTTAAVIQTNLIEGVYYLAVKNVGVGDPLSSSPSGYTSYGGIGQYFISGTVLPTGVAVPPGAQLQVTDILQPGVAVKQFTVTYTDNAGIDISTLGNNDILVTGPNGYSQAATFVGVDLNSDGTPRVATYAINPPGSVWSETDGGVYTISILANTVSDIEGMWVSAQSLGSFNVSVPRAIYFASMDTDPGWTLQGLWQFGPPQYTALGPTNGFTGTKILGYNLSGNYENRLSGVYATTPAINCSGVSSVTLQFQRWLRLRAGDTANIEVSVDGTSWSNVWSASQNIADSSWQEVQYALPSWVAGSPSVQLRWGHSSGQSGTEIGWNLDDVILLGNGNVDTTPPVASINIANITSDGAPNQVFTVTYTDNSGVKVATLGAGNIMVFGPNGYTNSAEFAGVDTSTDGTPRTASYSVNTPSGFWTDVDNGTYQVVLQAGQVSDVSGNFMDETVLGTFTVAISTNHQALVVSPATVTVPEGGDSTFSIRLAEQPSADVSVVVVKASGDADIQITSGATNIFTSVNWNVPVPVRLAALPDTDRLNGSATFECQSAGLATVTATANEQDTTTNNPPTVSVTSPLFGGTFSTSDTVNITAAASDDNAIAKVEFFANNNLIGTALNAPYGISTAFSAGSYSITAVATDNEGAATTSPAVSITVSAPNTPPAVSVTSPVPGATFLTSDTVNITAAASDDGTVTKVQFFANNNLIGTALNAPYGISTAFSAGAYSITAVATDNDGATATSSAVTITISAPNTPPTVSITSPSSGATFSTTDTVNITAAANDDGAVTKVQFFANNNLIGTVLNAPYGISTTFSAGTYSITAVATDNGGATKTSSAISITVRGLNTPPTVSVISPLTGTTIASGDPVTITADASDTGAITQVAFFENNNFLGIATSGPYTIQVSLADGAHSITAMATDDDGSSTTSGPVSVTVQAGNRAPTISLASPQSSEIQIAPGVVSLQATAADPDGTVAEVEFFNGMASVGVSATSPYQITLNDLPPGAYSFTAMVTDDLGAQTMSQAVTVNIIEQPTLQIAAAGASSDQLTISGTTGVPHILELSSDLKSWTPIATNTPVAGQVTFTDLRRQPNQFYRVTVQP